MAKDDSKLIADQAKEIASLKADKKGSQTGAFFILYGQPYYLCNDD